MGSCSFAKEIIVVDDESTDGTVAKAKAFGAKVFTRALAGNWGEQQTFAISKASCEWVFLIDADERVSPLLAQNLAKTLETKSPKSFLDSTGKPLQLRQKSSRHSAPGLGYAAFTERRRPGRRASPFDHLLALSSGKAIRTPHSFPVQKLGSLLQKV